MTAVAEPTSAARVDPHDVHPAARNPAPPMAFHEKSRMLAAARAARLRYPGAVGELVARELTDWEHFGWRVGGGENALIARLVDELMAPATP